MKKSLAVISILACILGLCACGSNSQTAVEPFLTVDEAVSVGTQTAEAIVMIVEQDAREQYEGQTVILAGIDSWKDSLDEIGTYTGVISASAEVEKDEAVIEVNMGGTSHDAVMEIIITEEGYTGISTTVTYSFGEIMAKAGLNTLIGMGVVFVVLILISIIISLFAFIPRIQSSLSKKNREAARAEKSDAVDNTIAQIIEKEQQADDSELVAVIAAAIAASEGASGTDDFVVRSIRRRG